MLPAKCLIKSGFGRKRRGTGPYEARQPIGDSSPKRCYILREVFFTER